MVLPLNDDHGVFSPSKTCSWVSLGLISPSFSRYGTDWIFSIRVKLFKTQCSKWGLVQGRLKQTARAKSHTQDKLKNPMAIEVDDPRPFRWVWLQ